MVHGSPEFFARGSGRAAQDIVSRSDREALILTRPGLAWRINRRPVSDAAEEDAPRIRRGSNARTLNPREKWKSPSSGERSASSGATYVRTNAHERDPLVHREGMRLALEEIAAGNIDPSPLYTHLYPLEEIGRAIAAAEERLEGFFKALVTAS